MYSVCSTTTTLVPDQHISESGVLPPLPPIWSEQIREQIFTHSSLTARCRGEFEVPPSNPSQDNEEYAHIGDQVISLTITDLIQDLHPRLRVGPTSKLKDRVKSGGGLAELAVQYGLHEILQVGAPSLRMSQGVQADVFKAYVGGLFREKGMDIVKQWLDPLFRPLIDAAYRAERREHLVPGSAVPGPSPQTVNSAKLDTASMIPHVGSMILSNLRCDPSPEKGKEAASNEYDSGSPHVGDRRVLKSSGNAPGENW